LNVEAGEAVAVRCSAAIAAVASTAQDAAIAHADIERVTAC
jgi:hypothetical protein